jgi:aspartyl-tRNA(Asn)/glutamyl-tRNA(Gln) amidotransferase subunit C
VTERPRITEEEARRVAELARIELDDADVTELTRQLARILDYVAELEAVDVTEVAPTVQPISASAPLRDDDPRPCLPSEEALAAGPRVEDGAFAVPRVLEPT